MIIREKKKSSDVSIWGLDISHQLFITISRSICSLRSPDIRKKTWCSELSERGFGMTKINQNLKKQGVRNESCPEDRNEQRQFFKEKL